MSRTLVQLFAAVLVFLFTVDCGAAQSRRARRRGRNAPDPTSTADTPAAPSTVGASPATRITTLRPGGGRLDWHGDKIAYDMVGADGKFNIHVMRGDGSGDRCLTCDHPDLPRTNIGQPAWDPSGRYLALQVEKEKHRQIRVRQAVTPGAGVLNDLWILDTQTNRATKVRDVPDEAGRGTLHPHFSHDGRLLTWSEMHTPGGLKKGQEVGHWYLMIGDLNWSGGRPSLSNVRNVTPAGPGFYENHGFSKDDSQLLFSSNFEARRRAENDIYILDLRSKRLSRLTQGGWNEHAQFSPDGRRIAWMSNADGAVGGADYWIMNADGSNKRRITFFNKKGHPDYMGRKTMVADLAWRPDGRAIAGYSGGKVVVTSTKDPSRIILVELPGN